MLELRHALGHEFVEGEDDVVRGNGLAVLSRGLGVYIEGNPSEVGGVLDLLGYEGIVDVDFVQRARHEGVKEVSVGPDRGNAAVGEAVEVVVGPDLGLAEDAALWSIWIDVVEMVESWLVLWRAVEGDRGGDRHLRRSGDQRHQSEKDDHRFAFSHTDLLSYVACLTENKTYV